MNPEIQAKATKAVETAVSRMLVSQPFFGTLALSLKYVATEAVGSHPIRTMATDGTHCFYNPSWVMEQSRGQLEFTIAHEVDHCASKHHLRRGNRDPKQWNKATDYVINIDMIDAKVGEPPEGILIDERFRGLSAEDVFAILENEQAQANEDAGDQGGDKGEPSDAGASGSGPDGSEPGEQDGSGEGEGQGDAQGGDSEATGGSGTPEGDEAGQSGGSGDGGSTGGSGAPGDDFDQPGEVLDAPGDAAQRAEEEAKWETLARQAVAVAKRQYGNLPGYAERLVAELNAPRVAWQDVLAQFIDSTVRFDYSFQHPDRRFHGSGMILPGMVKDSIDHGAVLIDVSGSMSDDANRACASELQAMLDQGIIDRLTVLYVDTEVRKVEEYESGDRVEFNVRAGGGTAFAPGFDWLDENEPDVAFAVYLTDLNGPHRLSAPAYPVLWAAYGSPERIKEFAEDIPFGDLVVVGD